MSPGAETEAMAWQVANCSCANSHIRPIAALDVDIFTDGDLLAKAETSEAGHHT